MLAEIRKCILVALEMRIIIIFVVHGMALCWLRRSTELPFFVCAKNISFY